MDGSLDQLYFQRSMVLGAVHELPTCNSWNTLTGQLPPLPMTPYGFDNSFHRQSFGRNWQCTPPAYQSSFGQSYNQVMLMPVFAQSCSVVQPQFIVRRLAASPTTWTTNKTGVASRATSPSCFIKHGGPRI